MGQRVDVFKKRSISVPLPVRWRPSWIQLRHPLKHPYGRLDVEFGLTGSSGAKRQNLSKKWIRPRGFLAAEIYFLFQTKVWNSNYWNILWPDVNNKLYIFPNRYCTVHLFRSKNCKVTSHQFQRVEKYFAAHPNVHCRQVAQVRYPDKGSIIQVWWTVTFQPFDS